MHEYKWDKRRARNDRLSRHLSLDVFDLVLLCVIFTIGVVLFKFLIAYTFNIMPCADYAANFGAGFTGPPAFKIVFNISILLFVFWLTLIISHPKRRNSISNIIWQSILLLSILLMGHSAFHMSIWGKSTPPDGTLAVADGVWGMRGGEKVWANIPLDPQIYEPIYGGVGFEQEYRTQRCVWLSDGLISVDKDPFIGDLDTFIKETELRWTTGGLRPLLGYIKWPGTSFKVYLRKFFSRKSQIETLRDNPEFVRALSDTERARFLAKQHCLEQQAYDPSSGTYPRPYTQLIEKCDPRNYPPWPIEDDN